MKKFFMLLLAVVATTNAHTAQAATEDNYLLAKTLSAAYGAVVDVNIDEEKCEIRYPQVIMKEEIAEFIPPSKPDEEPRYETKQQETPVPETIAQCSKIEDFNGKPQYKITHNSPNKLVAQVYNLSGLSFMKDVDIKTFNEEISVVLSTGLVSSSVLHIADASYTQTDKTTGLKSELGKLNDFKVSQNVQENDNIIKYKTNMLLSGLNIALPIFSMQIESAKQAAELEYKVPENFVFDYAEIWRNFEYLTLSKSKAAVKGISLAMDFVNFGIKFDLDTKNFAKLNAAGLIDSTGNMLISNVAFSGQMVEASKQFRSIAMRYGIKGINTKSFALLNQMQQEKLSDNKEPNPEELAQALDEAMETAVLDIDAEVKFANAAISAKLNAQKKNGYLLGAGRVSVNNLYNIFPEIKQCLNNPASSSIPKCSSDSMFAQLSEVIDVANNNPVIELKFNEQGIFRNGIKVAEPVELNFQKMMLEQEQLLQEEQDFTQQMDIDSDIDIDNNIDINTDIDDN